MRGLQVVGQQHLLAQTERLDKLRALHVARNPLLRFGAKFYSQNDEDGLIEEISRRIQGDRSGTFLEFGVGDGTENNTLNLLAQGWRGAWLGGEPLRLERTGNRLYFRKCWIDRDNIASLARDALRSCSIDQLDVLSMDLDGNDYHFCHALLKAGYRPSLWIVEYNGRFSPHTYWVMPYDPNHRWSGDDYFGASLVAFQDLFDEHGYRLVACNLTGANAFFVRRDFADLFPELPANWRLLVMPAEYVQFPVTGHQLSVRTIETLLNAEPTLSARAATPP